MNLDEAYQHLTELANCGDPYFAEAATVVGQSAQACQNGQMSPAELKELLLDVQRQITIVEEMNQLAFKEKLNTVITGLITIVGAVA